MNLSKRRFITALAAVFPGAVLAKTSLKADTPEASPPELITGSNGHVRALNIRVENADIGDGIFNREVADTLRGYAQAIDDGYRGNKGREEYTYVSERGSTTMIEVMAKNYYQGKEV